MLEKGEKIIQETRGWDENKEITFSQRQKETSDDYRYFPDPDIPKLMISQIEEFKNLAETLPELPSARRERYTLEYGIKPEDVESLVANPQYSELFEGVIIALSAEVAQLTANYLTSDLMGLDKNNKVKIFPAVEAMTSLIKMVQDNEVSSRGAKDILAVMVETGDGPRAIAEEKSLFQKSDEDELAKIIEQVISENAKQVAEYKAGNDKVLQYLVGQGMKLSGGAANPGLLAELLKKRL